MRSDLVPRDWAKLWPQVVAAKFNVPEERDAVLAMFKEYSGPEPDRIKLGVLKASDCNIERMRALLKLAGDDWRELLCEAEYPLSSRRWGLKEKAPEKYERLQAKEQAEYENWLQRVLAP